MAMFSVDCRRWSVALVSGTFGLSIIAFWLFTVVVFEIIEAVEDDGFYTVKCPFSVNFMTHKERSVF
jgi:hypothetical protein